MNWIANLLRSRGMKRDAAEEIESHLEERAAELIESGVPEREAYNRARREFGNPARVTEQAREVWTTQWLEQLVQDLRYSLRALRRAPAFTAVAILSLALGIGANTAVFSLLDGIMLKTLPVSHPEQLRILTWHRSARVPIDNHSGYTKKLADGRLVSGSFSYPAFQDFRKYSPEFEDLVGFAATQFVVTANSLTDYASGELVSGNYFSVLGAQPIIGRPIAPSDDDPAQPLVAVLTYRYWSRRFQQDPNILGGKITINNRPATVIGVMPPAFQGLGASRERDLFLPLAQVDVTQFKYWSRTFVESWWVQIFGRLRPGGSESAAAAELTATLARSIESYAAKSKTAVKPPVLLFPGARGVGSGREQMATRFYVLGGTVGLVLLIACVNLANLLLARASARQREIAIRLSIGATRWRLLRQLFTESILLSGIGGVAGLLVSGPLTQFLLANQGGGDPVAYDVRLDARTLAFTFGVSLLAGVAFGLAPAWRATRFGLRPAGSSVTHSRSRLRFHWLLISAQVAFSLVLLVTAGLFLRTLSGLSNVDLGFQAHNLLTFRTDVSRAGYKGPAVGAMYENLRHRLAETAGIEQVVLSQEGLINNSESDGIIYFPGRPKQTPPPHSMVLFCSDSFLTAMRIPVLRGRDIAPNDGPNSAVINESFRHEYFPNQDPIGQIFYWGASPTPEDRPLQVVGVVRDAYYYSVRAKPEPTVYVNYLRRPSLGAMYFAIRSPLPPATLAQAVRRAAAEVHSAIPIVDVRTQEEQIQRTLGTERLFAGLLSIFGLLATLLAAIGLYGVLSYAVSRRTAEIGIRMALGATRANVLWHMVRGCLLAVGIGLAAGLPAALALTKIARSLLYGVNPDDVPTFVAASVVLLAVSVAAAWIPARRGAAIQPTQALRYE